MIKFIIIILACMIAGELPATANARHTHHHVHHFRR